MTGRLKSRRGAIDSSTQHVDFPPYQATEPVFNRVDNSDAESVSSTDVVPIWKEKKNKDTRMRKIGTFLMMIFVLQVAGSAFDFPYIKISHMFDKIATALYPVAETLGYAVTYVSDIGAIFKRVIDFVKNSLEPIFRAIWDAFFEIFGSFFGMIYDFVSGFFSGYNIGLENVYNIPTTYFVSILVVVCSTLVVFLSLEAIGMYTNGLKYIRPSYFLINFFANNFYFVTYFITFMYSIVARTVTHFKQLLENIVRILFPYFAPIINKFYKAFDKILMAVYNTFKAPFMGIMNGFDYAMTTCRNNVGFTAAVAIMLCAITVAYFMDFDMRMSRFFK